MFRIRVRVRVRVRVGLPVGINIGKAVLMSLADKKNQEGQNELDNVEYFRPLAEPMV